MTRPVSLPVAMGEDAGVRGDLEEQRLGGSQIGELAPSAPGPQGHQMTVAEAASRGENRGNRSKTHVRGNYFHWMTGKVYRTYR